LDADTQVWQQRRWVVLYDTSASRTPGDLRAQRFVLERFLTHIDEDDQVAIAAFDTTVRDVAGGFEAADSYHLPELEKVLDAHASRPLRSTDLASALDYALLELASADSL